MSDPTRRILDDTVEHLVVMDDVLPLAEEINASDVAGAEFEDVLIELDSGPGPFKVIQPSPQPSCYQCFGTEVICAKCGIGGTDGCRCPNGSDRLESCPCVRSSTNAIIDSLRIERDNLILKSQDQSQKYAKLNEKYKHLDELLVKAQIAADGCDRDNADQDQLRHRLIGCGLKIESLGIEADQLKREIATLTHTESELVERFRAALTLIANHPADPDSIGFLQTTAQFALSNTG